MMVFLTGLCLAVAAGLVGVPLVLKKQAMLGDGLSHVSIMAVAIALAFGWAPVEFALPVVILVSVLLLKLDERGKSGGDTGVAVAAASSLAVGVLIAEFAGFDAELEGYLFGEITEIGGFETTLAVLLAASAVFVFLCFREEIFALTFNEKFARAIGVKTERYNILFAILSSVVVVLGMRIAGALLISSLLVFPVLTARQVTKSFRATVLGAAAIAVLNFLGGFAISQVLALPIGATVVVFSLAILTIFKLISLAK